MTGTFGEAVCRRRKKAELSQAFLAVLAGVSRNTISNIERGVGVTEEFTKLRVERALEQVESGAALEEHRSPTAVETGPCLLYVATDGTRHTIDADAWDPGTLCDRERAVFLALATHTFKRLGGAS